MSPEPPVRVVFFDDNRELADQVSGSWSRRGIELVGAAPTTTELYRLVDTTPFDVAVLDVRIAGVPGLPGLGVARWLLIHRPDVGVLVYTNHDYESGAAELLRAVPDDRVGRDRRGVAYLIKDRAVDLPSLIRRVNAGEDLVDDMLNTALVRRAGKEPHSGLSDQENNVLRLLHEGLTDRDIGRRIGIAEGTVADYLGAVYRKLGIPPGRNRRVTAAVHYVRHLEHFQRMSREPMIDWPPPRHASVEKG